MEEITNILSLIDEKNELKLVNLNTQEIMQSSEILQCQFIIQCSNQPIDCRNIIVNDDNIVDIHKEIYDDSGSI